MSTADTVWWIHPQDARSNEIIAETLTGLFSKDAANEHVQCADGVSRDLYRSPDYALIGRFIRSKKNGMKIDFLVFRSRGTGLPDLWTFTKKPKINIATITRKSNAIKRSALARR